MPCQQQGHQPHARCTHPVPPHLPQTHSLGHLEAPRQHKVTAQLPAVHWCHQPHTRCTHPVPPAPHSLGHLEAPRQHKVAAQLAGKVHGVQAVDVAGKGLQLTRHLRGAEGGGGQDGHVEGGVGGGWGGVGGAAEEGEVESAGVQHNSKCIALRST